MTLIGQDHFPKNPGQSCIICGSAPTLIEEFEEARKNMPDAVVIAINESAEAIWADHLFSYHYDKMRQFKQRSKNRKIIGHTGKPPRTPIKELDYWWYDSNSSGTSCAGAMNVALHMGMREIVIVACPLEAGLGYFNDATTFKSKPGSPRFGYMKPEYGMAHRHREGFIKNLERFPELREISRSMSGWTKKVLGGPSWQQT